MRGLAVRQAQAPAVRLDLGVKLCEVCVEVVDVLVDEVVDLVCLVDLSERGERAAAGFQTHRHCYCCSVRMKQCIDKGQGQARAATASWTNTSGS